MRRCDRCNCHFPDGYGAICGGCKRKDLPRVYHAPENPTNAKIYLPLNSIPGYIRHSEIFVPGKPGMDKVWYELIPI